jgi:hypothetical protein
MSLIPENLTDFLHWVKDRTERCWASLPPEHWLSGAHWIPLTDTQILAVEAQYSVQFPYQHREFLKVLHTLDRWEQWEAEEEIDVFTTVKAPFFYNWLEDREELLYRLEWPHMMLMDAMKSANLTMWWGQKAKDKQDKLQLFEDWYSKAPKLLPLRAHTFSISDVESRYNLITSMHGLDSIVAGNDMRHYLANHLMYSIVGSDLVQEVATYENVDPLSLEIEQLSKIGYYSEEFREVPFWGELIWNSQKGFRERLMALRRKEEE